MPTPKANSLSLQRIYGDPQLLALSNRLHFIRSRQANMKLPLDTLTTHDTSLRDPPQKPEPLFTRTALATETVGEGGPEKQRKVELRELKSQRYRESKQNSARCQLKIRQQREKEMRIKHIKRREVLVGEEKGRARLEAFEEGKLQAIKQSRSNRELVNDKLGWKKVEVKRQLLEEETRSLQIYQDALCYKSELMHRIKGLLGQQG